VVAVEGVWKYFGDFPALRDVSLNVSRGACLALLGRNGAGKTTLLRILAGFSKPAKGTVTIAGAAPRDLSARARVGYIGHGIAVWDELSAEENLRVFATLYGVDRAQIPVWLERVGLLRVREGLAREFSRGMRQRLAIARAFLHQPELLVLDEPFTSLDDRAIALLQSLLREARERGACVVMSTHQLREALELASDVVLLKNGRVAHSGERTEEMLKDPAWLYARYGEG